MSFQAEVAQRALPGSAATFETQAVLASVAHWWSLRAAKAGLNSPWTDVTYALKAQPPFPLPTVPRMAEIGDSTSSEQLGLLYVESLAGAERAKEGKHYTPAILAERLWEMTRSALGHPRGKDKRLPGLVRDPACGAGALLLPPLREHLRAAYKDNPAITMRSLGSLIQGIDMDPWSAWLTNVILGAETLATLARIPETRRSPVPLLAESGDGLKPGREKATATIMNPPYGRLRLADDVRADFAHVLYGHANIYGMFMASGADSTAQDGVLSCLVPTSFTAGRYFHKLRGHLAEIMPMCAMNFVEGRNGVFNGVLQETCLVTFKRRPVRKVKITRSNGHIETVAEIPAPKGEGLWLLPRESRDAAIAAAAARMPLTLKNAGWHASTGPLVWNRRKADLYSRPGKNRAMILWAADIDGGAVHRDAARDKSRYLALTVKSDSSVMLLDEPAILVQRTTSPEQCRRIVAADLSKEILDSFGGRVVIENHVNVLRPTAAAPLIQHDTLARVLQTNTMDRLMRCISGSVAVSSYEIDSLPLPDARVLASWEGLNTHELERAVALAYIPGAKI